MGYSEETNTLKLEIDTKMKELRELEERERKIRKEQREEKRAIRIRQHEEELQLKKMRPMYVILRHNAWHHVNRSKAKYIAYAWSKEHADNICEKLQTYDNENRQIYSYDNDDSPCYTEESYYDYEIIDPQTELLKLW